VSPWPSFASDRGFSDDQSAVSIFTTNGELDVQDQGNTSAEGLLKTLAYGITFGNRSVGHLQSQQRLIFMPPDVALPVAAEGWSKEDARNFIFENAYGSLGKFIHFMPPQDIRVEEEWRWIRDKTEQELLDTTMPLLASPDKIDIVVVGADRAKTLVFPTGPSAETIGIDQYLP